MRQPAVRLKRSFESARGRDTRCRSRSARSTRRAKPTRRRPRAAWSRIPRTADHGPCPDRRADPNAAPRRRRRPPRTAPSPARPPAPNASWPRPRRPGRFVGRRVAGIHERRPSVARTSRHRSRAPRPRARGRPRSAAGRSPSRRPAARSDRARESAWPGAGPRPRHALPGPRPWRRTRRARRCDGASSVWPAGPASGSRARPSTPLPPVRNSFMRVEPRAPGPRR